MTKTIRINRVKKVEKKLVRWVYPHGVADFRFVIEAFGFANGEAFGFAGEVAFETELKLGFCTVICFFGIGFDITDILFDGLRGLELVGFRDIAAGFCCTITGFPTVTFAGVFAIASIFLSSPF